LFLIPFVLSAPQFFGQSFSSSSFVNPSGEVVINTIYTDSDGNRVINGVNDPASPGSASASIVSQGSPSKVVSQPSPSKVTKKNTNIASRPDWETKPANTGAYVHDDSGKYKGN
jgi:hypothetical protein